MGTEDITENDRLQPGRPVSKAETAKGNPDFTSHDTEFIQRTGQEAAFEWSDPEHSTEICFKIDEGLGIVLVEAQTNGLPVIAADTIPEEVSLTDNFEFMPLEDGKLEWAKRILDRSKEKRNLENAKKVYEAGYDIRDVSLFLQNTYLEMYNN